ncbi:DNA polymerase delta, subunit 4-domain-containing protein, partial [Cyathus striatus]
RRSNSLRQGTLSFASMKRTASTASAGKVKKLATKSSSNAQLNLDDESSEENIDDIEFPSSGEESDRIVEETIARAPTSSKAKSNKAAVEEHPKRLFKPKNNIEILKSEDKASLADLNPKDPRWRKQYALAREQLNGLQPVHGENENRVHEILRIFDLSYQYGPCVGVTRLERWERAYALGLDPPSEIKEILSTRQGVEEAQYSQCVFYDEV